MTWDSLATRYSSADEMMAGYAGLRQRLSRPTVTVEDEGINLRRMPKGFRVASRRTLSEPANLPVVRIIPKQEWSTPTYTQMAQCEMPGSDAWRRFLNGFCFVLDGDDEMYCPSLNMPDFWSERDEDLINRVPRLKGGVVPKNAGEIVRAVAIKHNLTRTEMLSSRRRKHEVQARQETYWWLRALTPWSLPRIGRFLGGLDHTTILHGARKHQARIDAGEVV